jgi:hypothetical protein
MASGISAKASDVATDITAKATGQWDKLENIFEERVAKALSKMGMPTAKEVQALAKRVDELSAQLKKAPAKSATKQAAKSAIKPVVAAKTAVKVVAKKVVVAKKAVVKKASVKAVKTTADSK